MSFPSVLITVGLREWIDASAIFSTAALGWIRKCCL